MSFSNLHMKWGILMTWVALSLSTTASLRDNLRQATSTVTDSHSAFFSPSCHNSLNVSQTPRQYPRASTQRDTMAIIVGLQGIHVKVRVGNRDAREYRPLPSFEGKSTKPSATTNVVTKYISAAADEEFGILLSITSEYEHDCPTLGFDVFVDGVKVASKCCLQSKRGKFAGWKLLIEGTEMGNLDSGNGEVRPFKFSRVAVSNGTGEIAVEVHRRGEGERVILGDIPDFYVQQASAALKGKAMPQVISYVPKT